MTMLLELATPVMGARAGCHADRAWSQLLHQLQLGSANSASQYDLSTAVDTMDLKHVLGRFLTTRSTPSCRSLRYYARCEHAISDCTDVARGVRRSTGASATDRLCDADGQGLLVAPGDDREVSARESPQ